MLRSLALNINQQYSSPHYLSRGGAAVRFLVLHYTEVPLSTTLGIFMNNPAMAEKDAHYFTNTEIDTVKMCQQPVSAHYVNTESGELYQLVDEALAARHAGLSYWNGFRDLNVHSIGIEQENIGFDWSDQFPHERGRKVSGSNKKWCSYAEAQIDTTIALCQALIARYDVPPYHIVGHSDIACHRKIDPGPLFPWKKLADAGVGMWYDLTESTLGENNLPDDPQYWMQGKLAEFGYDCPADEPLDAEQLRPTISAFQHHFRPSHIDGQVDLECMKIIDSLCQRKYQMTCRNACKKK